MRDAEQTDDVILHARRGSGGEGERDRGLKIAAGFGEAQVVGAEVVAPLGEAVHFVDAEEAQWHTGEGVAERFAADSFGRGEDDLVLAVGQRAETARLFGGVKRRVDEGGGDVATGEAVNLILHQGHERREDERDAGRKQGGELIDERFAGAGGHDHQRIAASEDVVDGGFLAGAEGREVEVVMEGGERIQHLREV